MMWLLTGGSCYSDPNWRSQEKQTMVETNPATNPAQMHAPSYQLLVTTPMAAIMLSGRAHDQWSGMLQSVGPIYAAAAGDTQGEIDAALLTVAQVLAGGDAAVRQYFGDEGLDFARLMDISATGADFWMCRLSDGEISKADVIGLFQAIKAGLIEVAGDLRGDNEMIDQLIQTQDRIVEHIASLN